MEIANSKCGAGRIQDDHGTAFLCQEDRKYSTNDEPLLRDTGHNFNEFSLDKN